MFVYFEEWIHLQVAPGPSVWEPGGSDAMGDKDPKNETWRIVGCILTPFGRNTPWYINCARTSTAPKRFTIPPPCVNHGHERSKNLCGGTATPSSASIPTEEPVEWSMSVPVYRNLRLDLCSCLVKGSPILQ